MADNATELERLQRWFHAAITHPDGTRAGIDSERAMQFMPAADGSVDDVVLPSTALSSFERLSIYANMYFDRLIEIMAEEFPTVRRLVGAEMFGDLVRAYVTDHPSTSYSLAHLGRHFPHYLLETDIELPEREFAAAIATVERTMEDVFDERQDEALALEDLQAIPPDRWDTVRLRPIAALRLLTLPYPVNDAISAVRDGREIDIPAAETSYTAVYRRNYRVWRRDLSETQCTLLTALQGGRTLGDALGAAAAGGDAASLASSLYEWFQTWSSEGFFCELQHEGAVAPADQ